jgi:hypothetical protein
MATVTLVESDLHLADTLSIFKDFREIGDRQQCNELLHIVASPAHPAPSATKPERGAEVAPDAATNAASAAHSGRGAEISVSYITPLMPLRQADKVVFIINGDCFDFLVTMPYALNRVIDVKTAREKPEKTPAASGPEKKNSW